MGVLQEFVKGNIAPAAMSVGGALRPEAASRLIDLIVDQSGFLRGVTIERMQKLKKDINVMDILNRILVRVPEGTEPSDNQKSGVQQKGKTLDALNMQMFQTILFSTIEDNKGNPAYEDTLVQMFARKFANEAEDLAMNGTAETGADFLTLNKGYIQLAKDATTSIKVDLSGGELTELSLIIAAQQERFKGRSVFVMGRKKYDTLIDYMGQHAAGLMYLIQGNVPTYKGYNLVISPYMPDGYVLFTPLDNFIYGICTDIRRFREVRGTKRCIDYTFDIAVDFAYAVDEAVVIGIPT
jgi:hypothetical protein